ncbi:MAG TPA: hypothetical protein K8V56_10625 [Sporosarcina psychrophila]|uniref:Uncharacterized protein n=1 Tax=Sporosarcina psychrophila TaxID=1476 RepID=A0A921G0A6_SPOPS|nr:hypothetical protein [Sporosarcina psychrophila]
MAENTEEVVVTEEVPAEVKDVRDTFDETLEKVNADQEALRIDLEERASVLFQKEVAYTLKESGLEAFADVINVTDTEQLKGVTAKLTAIVNGIKTSVSFVPKENGKQDAVTIAEQNKDVKGMLGAKFSKLFK